MAELIAPGAAEASAEFALVDGTTAMVNLKAGAYPGLAAGTLPDEAQATIQLKASDATYLNLGQLSARNPAQVVVGPATYRIVRRGNPSGAVGVDKS